MNLLTKQKENQRLRKWTYGCWGKGQLGTLGRSYTYCYIYFFNFLLFLFFNFTILYWLCHISKWIRHRYTRAPHPEPSSLLPPCTIPWVIPVHQPQASSIVHQTWTGDSFHIWYYICFNAILPNHPTLALSHKSKRLFYISVSLLLCHIQGYHYHLSKFHIYALLLLLSHFSHVRLCATP